MAKFNRPGARARVDSPVTTTGTTTTHEGGAAWSRDTRSELVLLAVVNMVGESTFYESDGDRDSRFSSLCKRVAVDDGAWFLNFVTWLRGSANMRSAALVAAADGVAARIADRILKDSQGDGFDRKIVNAALLRADEPGEFLAYWHEHYGRVVPMSVKRGLGDAVIRLYTERSLLKYDTDSHAVRFGDVIDLTHPGDTEKAAQHLKGPWQGDLFTYALHRRHGYVDQVPDSLTVVKGNRMFRTTVLEHPNVLLDSQALNDAGMTWEDALSMSGSVVGSTLTKITKKQVWEAMIPNMGIMALIRNLRNFDECGVSDEAAAKVIARLQDPEEIARSRQFPYRFLSAHAAAPSLRWGYALEKALSFATANVPALPGRWLVAVDTSGSMQSPVSAKSKIRHVDVGALIGTVLASRSTGGADLVGYANGSFRHPLTKGGSVLRQIDAFTHRVGEVGHGTETSRALRENFNGHTGVVVVTDGQAFRDWGTWGAPTGSVSTAIPANVPLFGVDTTGYAASSIDTSKPNRFEVGGFSDKLFTMMGLLASGQSAKWPWED